MRYSTKLSFICCFSKLITLSLLQLSFHAAITLVLSVFQNLFLDGIMTLTKHFESDIFSLLPVMFITFHFVHLFLQSTVCLLIHLFFLLYVWFVRLFFRSFIRLYVYLFFHSTVCLLIHSFICFLFICSFFVYVFIYSFFYFFVCSFFTLLFVL